MSKLSSSLLLVLTAITLAIASGCERPSHADQSSTPQPLSPPPSPPTASAAPDTPLTEIAGDLRPILAANLSFKTGGILASIRVARGERVKKGQVLATLADTEARAAVAQADAAVQVARAQAAIAEDAQSRTKQLGDAAVVAASTVVTATLTAEAARAGIRQALAAASLARANLNNHVLTAPFSGVVVLVPDGPGETVGPGSPVMRLEDLDTLVMRTTTSERDLASIEVGSQITLETSNGQRAIGTVKTAIASLEPVTRRAPLEIVVPNHEGLLSAGAYVRAWLPAATNEVQP